MVIFAGEQSANVMVGQIINHYKIVGQLGAGGMGEVYLADDTRLQRRVALKFLPKHFTEDRKHLRRFQQEALTVAALSHPNVCTIHEVIETGEGRHCIVMEYVNGLTLRQRIAISRMDIGEALDVAIQVASALSSVLFFRKNSTPSPTEISSLAVLPLENLSGDPAQDYFADGMTESLITDLTKIGALRVSSRPSVMQYKGTRKSVPEIGRELNVDAVLTGSVARSGTHATIAVQLIHAATDRKLWTANYDRDLRDVLALPGDVTRDIVSKIKVQVTTQEQVSLRESRPVNPEAYDQYLRGKFYLHRQNREDNEAAISALEQAVKTDPNFAAAHAELAQAYVWKLFLFTPEEKQWSEKAFVEAEKALNLDKNLAVAISRAVDFCGRPRIVFLMKRQYESINTH